MRENTDAPRAIQVRGARVHNLKNIDVDIPLDRIVGIAGVSGSGKSSLALGVLYAEGSRRYLESLSTYTRRRMTQAGRADVEEVRYVPAALALHQRPGVPGIRSTFGTGTELLNSLRLMFSRLASHRCPNGHYLEPSLAVAAGQALTCPVCGETFYAPSAEELSFNSQGACPVCSGTGVVRTVDRSTLVPDDSLTIDQGAVAPWNTLMWSLMTDVCRSMGVRTDVPFRELTDEEKHIVYDGPAVKKHILYHAKNSNDVAELDFTYFSAVYTVENALSKVKDEKGMKRVEKFLREDACSACGGTRLSEAARAPRLRGIGLDEACRMTLTDLSAWVEGVPASLPEDMRPMAESICEAFQGAAGRLMDLGLGYLTMDRAAATLSTGERQRMQLARAVRNRTTGVLYVLDEPSIGLHPANLRGLTAVMDDLVSDGNSVLLVDHDTQVLSHADYIVEMGPGAGAHLHDIVRVGEDLGVVVHQEDRVAVGDQVVHHRRQPPEVGRVEADGGLVQHIEDAGGAVAHRPGQLHPLPLPGGEGGRRPVHGQIAQPQVHEPPRRPLEGLADALRHGTHVLREGGGHALHPGGQVREGHPAGLVQADAPEARGPGGLGEPGAAAGGARVLPQELLHPLHALLILHLGEGVLHRVHGGEVGEVQLRHVVGVFGVIEDVLLHRRTVVDDVLLLVGEFPEGHVGADPHAAAHVGHQGPHEGIPGGHGPLIDGEGVVWHQGGPVHGAHHAGAGADGTGPLAVEGQLLGGGGVKRLSAHRAGQGLPRRHRQGRLQIVAVGAAVAGQTGEHEPQGVQQLRPGAEGAADAGHAGPLVEGQGGGDVAHLLHVRPTGLGHAPSRVGGQ